MVAGDCGAWRVVHGVDFDMNSGGTCIEDCNLG